MTPVKIWNNMWETLSDVTIAGFSIKKVMAAIGFTLMIVLSSIYTYRENLILVLGFWQTFILILLKIRYDEKKNKLMPKKEGE